MVLVFGVEVPLIEIILTIAIILFLILIESIIVITLLLKEMNKSKKLAGMIEKLSQVILSIKESEIKELDKLRGRR